MPAKSNEIDVHRNLANKYRVISEQKYFLEYQDYWNKMILELSPKERGSFVLDCGCGIGRTLKALLSNYDNVFGIDLSCDMLDVACSQSEGIRVMACDAQNMAIKDDKFDMVICKGSLHHLREPQTAVKEINRILKRGGVLAVSEPCRDNAFWRKAGSVYVRLSSNFSHDHGLFNSAALKDMLTKNGFIIDKTRYLGFIAFPLCGLAYQFPIMNFMPFSHRLTKLLIRLDEFIMRVPFLNSFHWHAVIQCRKT